VVIPKFDQHNIFEKFKNNLVKKGLKQQKMAREIDFRAPAGPESLRTTDEKVEILHIHVKSRNYQF
jgi:hypothetical protein